MERHPSLDDRFDPAVRSVEHDPDWAARAAAELARLGYLFVPVPESPDHHFFARPPQRPRSHHLHVREAGSEHELRHLAVRDFLRAHPNDRLGRLRAGPSDHDLVPRSGLRRRKEGS